MTVSDGTPDVPGHGFWESGRGMSWDCALQRAEALREELTRLGPPDTVQATIRGGLDLTIALLAVRPLPTWLLVTGKHIPATAVKEIPAGAQLLPGEHPGDFLVQPADDVETASAPTRGGLVLLTSGTTGAPKPVHRSWAIPDGDRDWLGTGTEHWGIGYAAHTFAGVSALCQALSRASTIEFIRPADLSSSTRTATPLTVATGTPSFWRIVAAGAGPGAAIREIDTVSVGGEPVDDNLLITVRSMIRPRRINQIFGTTEFGSVLAIDDGLAGLPAHRLRRRGSNGAAFDVEDGRLRVSTAVDSPYVATGDLVEQRNGRIHIIGHDDMHVNVGGIKVNPYRVVTVLHQHENVLAARAYSIRSPVLGEVVAADVVPRVACDAQSLIGDIKRFTALHLSDYERPRLIRLVARLHLAPSGKVAR